MNPLHPRNLPYRSRWAHDNCKPLTDRCDYAEHSQARVNELSWRMAGNDLASEIEQALASGQMPPRRRAGDPGE